MKKIILFLLLGIIFINSCSLIQKENTNINEIDKDSCEKSRGNWNECSSPCLGTGNQVCIDMCIAQCECGGIAGFGCPEGYNCRLSGKIADEMGACVK